MKALVYTAPHRVEIRDEPDPAVAEGEALVQVDAVGICGSDMHAFQGHDGRRIPPLILGHEIAARVLSGSREGQRVILNPLIACTRCRYCRSGRGNLCAKRTMIGMTRPGGFAERLSIPEQCLIAVPEDMNPLHAALTEPAATAVHALRLAARMLAVPVAESSVMEKFGVMANCRVMVIGAGSVGLLAALLVRDQGCDELTLVEANPLRRETAQRAIGCAVVDPADASLEDPRFDLIVDAVGGRATRELAIRTAAPGAVVVHVGLMDNEGGIDARRITLAEIAFIGTYTYTEDDLRTAAHQLYSGALGRLEWAQARSLDDGPAAFDDLLHGRCAAAKIVLQPGGGAR